MSTAAEKKPTLVLIDGNAIIHRAYHAVPPLTTKDGTVVNAVYGFVTMLLRVRDELSPTHLAVCFDLPGGTFRDELYTEYKATRQKTDDDLIKQIPLVHDVVRAFGIPIYTKEGFEADDVIGTIAADETLRKKDMETIIVTGDMDILQLIDDHTRVYELRKGLADVIIFDAEKVKEKYGFGPEHIIDYKALRGDTSDNIPGIKGIGEKTATELLTLAGGLDDIYTDLASPNSLVRRTMKKGVIEKLDNGKASADLSRTLATIRRDVPDVHFSLTDTLVQPTPTETLEPLFQRFEFFSLLKRLRGGAPHPRAAENNAANLPLVHVSAESLPKILRAIPTNAPLLVSDVILGNDILSGTLTHIILGTEKETYVIPVEAIKKHAALFISTLQQASLLLGHDLKRTIKTLIHENLSVSVPLFDIMIASYVVNSSTRAHDLASIALRELHITLPEQTAQTTLFGTDVEGVAKTLSVLWPLWHTFKKLLTEHDEAAVFETIEMKLIPVLARMELAGVALDSSALHTLSKTVHHTLEKLTTDIYKEAGQEFNIASNNQLRDILFETLGLPTDGVKKGKTGYSTAASELEKLRDAHAIIPLIEEYRELAKLQNTYVDVLPSLVNPKTGRIHTHFNQTIAATGRLSSTDPNLQNIPIRTELGAQVRNTFIAEKGYRLISADYSQMELRIVASLANDAKMIEIFSAGKDIHTSTAAAIHGVPESEVTKDMRYAAKAINFGILYGMGSFGLSNRAHIPQWQAKEFIAAYFTQFSGVKEWIDKTLATAKKTGYVETLHGRKRYVPELLSNNYQLRAAGERMAVNMPVQGTLADMTKLAMIALEEKLLVAYAPEDVRLLLQVHDELVLECREHLVEEVEALASKTMIDVVTLRVPIEVHVAHGVHWGELK